MDKFTKIKKDDTIQVQKDKNALVYAGKYINIIKEGDFDIVSEKDSVACIIYFQDEGFILMRREPVTTWQYKFKNDVKKISGLFLTPIAGTIDNNESPQECLRRELYEETGIILGQFYKFDIQGPFFASKSTTKQFYTSIVTLNFNDYRIVNAPTDGSIIEKISKNVKVSLGDIDEIKINDLAGQLLINQLKSEFNI